MTTIALPVAIALSAFLTLLTYVLATGLHATMKRAKTAEDRLASLEKIEAERSSERLEMIRERIKAAIKA